MGPEDGCRRSDWGVTSGLRSGLSIVGCFVQTSTKVRSQRRVSTGIDDATNDRQDHQDRKRRNAGSRLFEVEEPTCRSRAV